MAIHDKIEVWTNRLTSGKLPTNWAWFRYFYQLCPRVKYGLSCNALLVADLLGQESKGQPLRKVYIKILPYLGVNRNTKAGWRQLHPTFGGYWNPLSAEGSRHWANQPLCATLQHAFNLGEQAENLPSGASDGSRNKRMTPPNTLTTTGPDHNSMLDSIFLAVRGPLSL